MTQVLSPPAATSVVNFRGLDVLRCCAALAVVIYHSSSGFNEFLPKAPVRFLHNLPVGVDFFFLISGFLITYLLLTEKDRAGTISLRRFYVRRSLRIFPSTTSPWPLRGTCIPRQTQTSTSPASWLS